MTIKSWIIVSILFALTIAAACAPSRQVGGSPTSDMMDPDSTGDGPNPFSLPTMRYVFDLSEAATVDVYVDDVEDRRVRLLLDGVRMPAGRLKVEWDGRDDAGRSLPSAIYYVVLEAEGRREVRKTVLIN